MWGLLFGFVTSFLLTYAIIPLIIRVAQERRIYDHPNARSSHQEPTPSLGGIAIFAGTVCSTVFWTPVGSFAGLQYILAAFVLIFLIGILDDLLPISPGKKVVGQLLVAFLLSFKASVRVTSFYGFLGIHSLSEPTSFLLSMLAIVGIINAFNLIDGINGLAGSVGLLTCCLFGTWFAAVDMLALAAVAFSLAGAIVAFLRYNFTPARIFMGDTGSLLIGTVCAMLAILFIESNYQLGAGHPFAIRAAPAIALAVLFLPVFDTISVMIRRMLRGKSPFSPDKTHIHHQLLQLGLSHTQTTGVLILFNLIMIALSVSVNQYGLYKVLLLLTGAAVLVSSLLFWLRKRLIFKN